jgi:Ca2+-binding RTX toxin-like protein
LKKETNIAIKSLFGGDGGDFLDGSFGVDLLYGGAGDDYYYVDDPNDVVVEYVNEGFDVVGSFSSSYTLSANVENLSLFSGAISGTGNELNNAIYAYEDNNILDGADGNDTIEAGQGNDSLKGGSGNDFLYGGGQFSPTTNTGDDRLDGGIGNDSMYGQDGNDTYVVDSIGDIVVENIAEGFDTVESSISYTLGANLEGLTLVGTAAINGTGNNLDNYIYGNNLKNSLNGGDGNDDLDGADGNDTLLGGNGNDQIYGGYGNDSLVGGSGNDYFFGDRGNDVLNGGSGNDTFELGAVQDTLTGGTGQDIFAYYSSSVLSVGVARINDFSVIDDTIQVYQPTFGGGLTANSLIAPGQFRLGSAAQDADDRFIYNKSTGGLFYDSDGIGVIQAQQLATLSLNLNLTYQDFYVMG